MFMRHKKMLWLASAFIFVPLLVMVLFVLSATVIPVGTFRQLEKQHSAVEQKRETQAQITQAQKLYETSPKLQQMTDETIVVGVNTAGTVRVNNLA